jgi:hypothetical protein
MKVGETSFQCSLVVHTMAQTDIPTQFILCFLKDQTEQVAG